MISDHYDVEDEFDLELT